MPPVPIPNLDFTNQSASGDSFSGAGSGVSLGNYSKGFTTQQMLIAAAFALVLYKVVTK